VSVSPAFGAVLGITALVTLLLGIIPGPLIAWASDSARILLAALR